jgi:HlyD family secretion protein
MTRRGRVRLLIRLGIFLLVVAGSVFGLHELRRTRGVPDLPGSAARRGDFLVLVRCRGALSAQRSVQLNAPLDVPDLQIVWMVPSGSVVKPGDTVIKFDPSHSQQDLKEKTAALRQAQASLDQETAQARITADQDKLDLATAVYQVEKARLEASKKTIVSAIEGQESAIDLGMAEEKLKVQQAATSLHKSSEEAKIASLTRLRDEAQREVDLTTHRLTLMELKSPLNGVVSYLPNYTQGWQNAQNYKVGDHAFPGGTLAEIPDLSTLQVETKVDEIDRGRIKVGDTVQVHVDAFPEKTLPGKLASISPLTEESFEEWPPMHNFKAYALIETPDPRMRPGMNAGADVVEQRIPNAISIPSKALFTADAKPVVYVKMQGQYVAVPVLVTARNPDEVAVEGIAAGTMVALTDPTRENK